MSCMENLIRGASIFCGVIFILQLFLNGIESSLSSCQCNLDLSTMKRDVSIQEHDELKSSIRLFLSSCTCAIFKKPPNASTPRQLFHWDIINSQNNFDLEFERKPHKNGTIKLPFIVEDPTNGITKSTVYRVNIVYQPDTPNVFLVRRGRDILNASSFIQISLDQDTGFTYQFGAFDYDPADSLTPLIVKAPQLGKFELLSASNKTLLQPPTSICNNASNHQVPNLHSPTVYYPCDLLLPYPAHELGWTSSWLRYTPPKFFLGNVTFEIKVADLNTRGTTIKGTISMLKNPCQNDGVCKGTPNDPHCTSPARILWFEFLGYTCHCQPGWEGSYCERNYDDCISSPCLAPKICEDRHLGYVCVCPSKMEHCDVVLRPWQTAMIVVVTGMGICALTVGLIMVSRRRNAVFLDSFHTGVQTVSWQRLTESSHSIPLSLDGTDPDQTDKNDVQKGANIPDDHDGLDRQKRETSFV